MIIARNAALSLALALLAPAASGCGSKGAVSLVATVQSPTLTVEQAALGTGVTGDMELVLELGEYADDDTEVSLGTFSVVRGSEELIASLALSPEGSVFPVTVSPGGSERVTLTFGGDQAYPASITEALCSGPLKYRGGVTDTASGKATSAASAEFTPSCP